MAKNCSTIYLGFVDECITEKYKACVNFTTNKIGGLADFPTPGIIVPNCPICGLSRPLIIQIYAPLENSSFHRILYIFACLSPSCSNQSRSWLCIRSQILEKPYEKDNSKSVQLASNTVNINWCSAADDWDEFVELKNSDVENCNEENGNIIKHENRMSDEDDESNSYENDLIPGFENIQVDDRNANNGAQGAVGVNTSPKASAEIEGDETELITIDTPITPQRDLVALLKQSPAIHSDLANLTLKSFFISVDEETKQTCFGNSDHIRELLQDYQMKDEIKTSPESPGNVAAGGANGDSDNEQYEKTTPAHGDVMFHTFLTRIQENPGQILRYSRDAAPLLISQIGENITKCSNCGGDVICEMQILPTIIPNLILENNEPVPIEFGNILVYTCIKSCWDTPDKMRIENVIVQQES